MQTGKWQLIRVTLFARACIRVLSCIYILFRSGTWRIYLNISLSAKFSQRNKGINLIQSKSSKLNSQCGNKT